MTKKDSKDVKKDVEVTAEVLTSVADADQPVDDNGAEGEAMSQLPTAAIIGDLRGQYGEWTPIEGQARKRLYRLLGNIYEAIPVFEGDDTKRNELQAIVRKDDEAARSKSFIIMEAEVIDLLLVSVLSVGRMTSATRSQWRSALLTARLAKVDHNAASFEEWISKIGGMVKAAKGFDGIEAKKPRGGADETDGILVTPARFNLDTYVAGLSTRPTASQLEVELDPKVDLFKGLGVLLVYTSPDDPNGAVQLINKVGDEGVIKRVAQEVASGHVHHLTSGEKLALLHEQRLWAINKVALILAGRLDAKFDLKTLRAFTAALSGLTKNDQHQQQYFKGQAGVVFSTIALTNLWTMEIAHTEFLDVDPGRYFEGGRPNALIPYDVSAYDTPEGDAAIKEYISANTEPWRVKPGHMAKAQR